MKRPFYRVILMGAVTAVDHAMTSVRMLLRRFRLRTGTPIVTLICSEFWADKRRLHPHPSS